MHLINFETCLGEHAGHGSEMDGDSGRHFFFHIFQAVLFLFVSLVLSCMACFCMHIV